MDRKPVPPTRNPSFFKVLIGDFTKQLKIPPAYVKRVECFNGAYLCQSCILRSHANDKLWLVYVKMVDNKLCFEEGWGRFVRDNSLEFGDLLIFRYAGNLQFVVEIYDTTCCEKEVVRTQEMNNCKPRVVKRNTGPAARSKTFSSVDDAVTDHGHGKNGALATATKFLSKSKYPSFKITMRTAYVLRRFLNMPSGFLTHMKSGIRNVKIDVLDNSWEVRLLTAGLRGRLSGGWGQCARDNSLQLDDVCVFELINKNDSVLKLSIFRKNMMKR